MLHLFSVYDKRTETYGDPFAVAHAEIAVRGFEEASRTQGSFLQKNPLDYQLCKIGTFDQETGAVTATSTPIVMAQNKPEN